MSAPPLPPRPYYEQTNNNNGDRPPPLPPLPADLRAQTERYNTPSVYELSPPHFENPLIAPRPHRVDPSVPANMAQTLADQSWSPWGNSYQQPNAADVSQSLANLSMAPSLPISPTYTTPRPAPQAPPKPASPPSSSIPSLTAPLPILAQLQTAAPVVQSPNHDPALKIAWCRDIFFLIDRSQPSGVTSSTDPPIGPISIPDPALARLSQIAVPLALAISNTPISTGQKMPAYIAEAISMRAMFAATGAFPEFVRHNPRTAFRDFEASARGGFASAWFRLGRDYENFNDHTHAKECFERGIKLNVESCLYRMGMAHLLGQLSLPSNPPLALPLLHRAATLSSLTCPQPAYVYALLLLSEFTQITLPPYLFSSFIPPGSSPTLEARKHLERAAYLHFPAAQYKLGHAYEFAEPPFPFDALLSVQYYSLASQQGEVEADMALSKWFLCGSGGAAVAGQAPSQGGFDKDEALALTFAEKAARKGLPSAEFAMGYYAEVGVGRPKDLAAAMQWYTLASEHGNADATTRLSALSAPSGAQSLSRQEHDSITEQKLVRRRTMAAQRAENQPLSPPWEGTTFPTIKQAGMGVAGMGGIAGRRREDGRLVVDVIRKNSLAAGYNPSSSTPPNRGHYEPSSTPPHRTTSPGRPQAQRTDSPQRIAYSTQRTESPSGGASGRKTPPAAPLGARPPSPGRRLQKSQHQHTSSTGSASGTGTSSPRPGGGRAPSPGRLARIRLNLDDPGPVPLPTPPSNSSSPYPSQPPYTSTPQTPYTSTPPKTATPATPMATPKPQQGSFGAGGGKQQPQTFAEMGIHGTKVDDEKCVIM